MKRYASQRNRPSTKRHDPVAFPLQSADLSPFVSASQPVPPNYSLYALVRHSGTLHYGHYTAAIRKGEQWLEVNDDRVRPIAAASLRTPEARKSAYLLFYARDPPPPRQSDGADGGAAGGAAGGERGAGVHTLFDMVGLGGAGVEAASERRVPRQTLADPHSWPFDIGVIPPQYRSGQAAGAAGASKRADGDSGRGGSGGRGAGQAEAADGSASSAATGGTQRPRKSGDVVLTVEQMSPPKPKGRGVRSSSGGSGVGVEAAGSEAGAGANSPAAIARRKGSKVTGEGQPIIEMTAVAYGGTSSIGKAANVGLKTGAVVARAQPNLRA